MSVPFVRASGITADADASSQSTSGEAPAPARTEDAPLSRGDRAYRAKHWLLNRLLDVAAHPLRLVGPRSTAQRRAYHFARFLTAALQPLVRKRPDCMAPLDVAILNQLTIVFSRSEPGFPILFNLTGEHHLEAAERLGKGVLIATVHTRLALSSHTALRSDRGSPLIVGNFTGRDIRGWNWGHAAPLNTIEARDPVLFRKLARQLANRRRVVCFVDHGQSTDRPECMTISPNSFVWAQGAGIPVVFMLARLNSRGVIEIVLHREPTNDASGMIDGFIRFIEREGGWRCEVDRRKLAGRRNNATPGQSPTKSSDREVAVAA